MTKCEHEVWCRVWIPAINALLAEGLGGVAFGLCEDCGRRLSGFAFPGGEIEIEDMGSDTRRARRDVSAVPLGGPRSQAL